MYNDQDKEHLWVKAKTVYKFIERCKDLKYILKSKIVFKRYQLCITIIKSYFANNNCENANRRDYLVINFNNMLPG